MKFENPAAIGMLLTDEEDEEAALAREDKVIKYLMQSDCFFCPTFSFWVKFKMITILSSDGHDGGTVA